jgi:hypothetical protein
MATFGYSVGDFIAAATVIYQVIRAFDSIDGATKQHKQSLAFLRGLALVCEYLDRNCYNLRPDIIPHANTIWQHYIELDKQLKKYNALTSKEPNEIKKAFSTVRYAFDDMSGKVQKMKDAAMDAVAIVETYVVLEIR